MYDVDEMSYAFRLMASGQNYSQVSRATGVSRATLRRWNVDGLPERGLARRAGTCFHCAGYRFPVPNMTEISYAYLLGLYLGDGSIATHPKGVFRLRVSLDRAYAGIVAECAAAMAIVMPGSKVSVIRAKTCRLDEPSAFSRHWPCLFPQHGSGVKHHRLIKLQPWQRKIVDRYPMRFLRGLIHSDGCRFTNTIKHPKKTYRYPRYNFTNRSRDIRGLFCEYCDSVDVEWRQMNRFSISVARRESVMLMDRHIGPKR